MTASGTTRPTSCSATQLETAIKHNPQDILSHFFLGQAHHFQYAAHQAKYQTIPEDQLEAPEAKAVLDQLNQEADKVIESWTKVIALAGTDPARKPLRETVQPTVVELYKYRHPETPDGWQTLVNSPGGATAPAGGAGK